MVGEYSPVASATVELPRDLASVRGSIVADATVKTLHAHRGLKPIGIYTSFFPSRLRRPMCGRSSTFRKRVSFYGAMPQRSYLAKTVLLARRLPVCFDRVRRKTWGRSPRK